MKISHRGLQTRARKAARTHQLTAARLQLPTQGPAAPGMFLKTCNLETSCKSLTQSSSPRTRGSRTNIAGRSCHRACSGCLPQPQHGPLLTPRWWKHCRGVAADNTAALPREDLGTGTSYRHCVQTPNRNRRLPTNCLPPHHPCSSYSNPEPQIPKAPLPPKILHSSTKLLHAPWMLLYQIAKATQHPLTGSAGHTFRTVLCYSKLRAKPSRFPRTTPSSSWPKSSCKTQNSFFVIC